MSISYKSIVGHTARATLPSVDTWGTNMNILRDPPKGIFTQRVDKISDTSEITQMIQDSGDRANEAILVYARGVNPMVSVSYDNYGNNGGQRRGNKASAGMVDGSFNSGKQSYLPYRIANGGAFRPPTRDLRELLPLSRLPRVWTSSFTNPGFADFSKKMMCPDGSCTLKENRKEPIKACVRPTMTYKIQSPLVENYDVKNVIKNPIKVKGDTGSRPNVRYNAEHGELPVGRIIDNPLRQNINVNPIAPNNKKTKTDHLNTERYIQDHLSMNADTNKSRNIQTNSIDKIMNMDTGNYIQDTMNLSYEGRQQSAKSNYDYMYNNDITLENKLPVYDVHTNTTRNIHKRIENEGNNVYVAERPNIQAKTNSTGRQTFDEVGTRDYALKPTITAGGYNPNVGVPSVYHHDNTEYSMDSQKVDFRKRVYDMQSERQATMNESMIF